MAVEPLDWERALDCFGDRELLVSSIEMFLQDSEKELDRLAEAVQSMDLEAVKEQAHALKGALLYLHAAAAADAARKLQVAARSGDSTRLPALLAELGHELARLRRSFPFS